MRGGNSLSRQNYSKTAEKCSKTEEGHLSTSAIYEEKNQNPNFWGKKCPEN
jgi:hypothetical protein